MSYRYQSHYKGTCAKCGKEGHSIAQCKYASESNKVEFFKNVKETKAEKANKGNNGHNVKFDKKAKKYDGLDSDPAMQH